MRFVTVTGATRLDAPDGRGSDPVSDYIGLSGSDQCELSDHNDYAH